MTENTKTADVKVVNVTPRWIFFPIIIILVNLTLVLSFISQTDDEAQKYISDLAVACAVDSLPRPDADYFAAISERYYFWQAAVCLFMVVSLGAVVLSGYIWFWCARTGKDRRRIVYTGFVFALVLLCAFLIVMHVMGKSGTFYTEHFITAVEDFRQQRGVLEEQVVKTEDVEGYMRFIRKIGLGAAFFVATAFFALLLFPAKVDSNLLNQRMRMLRILLYSAAFVFVSGILLLSAETSWLGAIIGAGTGAEKALAGVVRSGTERAGVVYTTMIGSVFIPCFWIMYRAAQELGRKATDGGGIKEVQEWVNAEGIGTSWQHVVRSALAVMAPLLSAPIGDALGKLLTGGVG